MVKKYLQTSGEISKKRNIPAHPHFSRSAIVGEEIVTADSYEDTAIDKPLLVPYHSFTDEVKGGGDMKKIGSANGSVTMLDAARVAEKFLAMWNALSPAPVEPAAPAAPAEPAAPAASVEPSK